MLTLDSASVLVLRIEKVKLGFFWKHLFVRTPKQKIMGPMSSFHWNLLETGIFQEKV
jgi:hypothetical protein